MWKKLCILIIFCSKTMWASQQIFHQHLFDEAIKYVLLYGEKSSTDDSKKIISTYKSVESTILVFQNKVEILSSSHNWRDSMACFTNTPIELFINQLGMSKSLQEVENMGNKLDIIVSHNDTSWEFFRDLQSNFIGKPQEQKKQDQSNLKDKIFVSKKISGEISDDEEWPLEYTDEELRVNQQQDNAAQSFNSILSYVAALKKTISL